MPTSRRRIIIVHPSQHRRYAEKSMTPFRLAIISALAVSALRRGGTLPFAPVQAALFSVPNSLSNAWGDFDNDGDLDLAVSIGTGEIRLYRNDKGVMVNVGQRLGMPQQG